jgi:type VI secretion system protein ImpA
MNNIDIESLLMEVSPEAPSGEMDLGDDPAFIDLAIAIEGTPEREFGGKIMQEAKEPDWSNIQKAALELLSRGHDLRVAMFLTRALLRTDGFNGLSGGLALLHGLIDRYWESLYPRLDPEDNHDPIQRINILAALSEGEDILGPLKKMALCKSPRMGQYCFRDILIATGKIDATPNDKSPAPTMADIEAAFIDTEDQELSQNMTAIAAARRQLTRLQACLDETVADPYSSTVPDFKQLSEVLAEMNAILDKQLQQREPTQTATQHQEANTNPGDDVSSGAGNTPLIQGTLNAINSRKDVIHLLDQICRYYQQHEPGSPVPLLLKRARDLVEKNFIEIIQDLAPDSAGKIQTLIRGDESKS